MSGLLILRWLLEAAVFSVEASASLDWQLPLSITSHALTSPPRSEGFICYCYYMARSFGILTTSVKSFFAYRCYSIYDEIIS